MKHIEPTVWNPIKKAIWDIIISERINEPKYINAFEFTDKLFTAVFTAIQETVNHIEPVCWTSEEQIHKVQSDPECNVLIWGEPLVHHPDVALVRLSDMQNAMKILKTNKEQTNGKD